MSTILSASEAGAAADASPPAGESGRVAAVGAQIAGALASVAEAAVIGGRWTRAWDALGQAQPHDPVARIAWAGANRYALIAGAAAIGGAATGGWATADSWRRAGLAVRDGCWGVVALRDRGNGPEAVTVYNACQVAGTAPVATRFDAPPALGAPDVDQMFAAAAGGVVSSDDNPERRASQLACAAISKAEVRLGYRGGWAAPDEALAGVLASQIVVNSLGFRHCPRQPPAESAEAWSSMLRAPGGGQAALAVASRASRLAASVVEQIAAGRLHLPALPLEEARQECPQTGMG